MVALTVLAASLAATLKALLYGGSPFAGFTALWPTNDEGKYVIEAEGIRLAFTNRNGGAPTNLWINDTNGSEIDILLGLDHVEDYDDYVGQLGGTIGMDLHNHTLLASTSTSRLSYADIVHCGPSCWTHQRRQVRAQW